MKRAGDQPYKCVGDDCGYRNANMIGYNVRLSDRTCVT